MEKDEGTGRARLLHSAVLGVPTALAAAGLGAAMLHGAVGATLSSAQGFTLQSSAINSSGLKIRPGAARVAGGDKATIYAQTGSDTVADGVDITAKVDTGLPVIGTVSLLMSSTDESISLGAIVLNARDLSVADRDTAKNATNGSNGAASLSDVDLGIAQSLAGFDHTTDAEGRSSGYQAAGFAITAGTSVLNNVDATAYGIHLAGLNLDNLSIRVTN
ncbi:MAG: DUF6230 family protein [Nocardioides sp.]|uniref:DUF6230 family protein n=1 Tax=Nocardioides sp. TaxID=35761 RepID=UPI0039E3B6C8